jgi:hypothetical protein
MTLTHAQRERWVNEISERMISPRPLLDSPAQEALDWLEMLERIEQSSGRPVQPPHAFISDRPERFIRAFANRPAPSYTIEFTRRNHPGFAWRFRAFIHPLFPENAAIYITPYMDGVETLEIPTTTLTREQVQGILDEANAHFARQQRNSGNDIPE